MRFAEDRFSASMMISSSIRESLTGWQLDCTTNMSPPRTFSSILTRISPSLNDPTVASPSLVQGKHKSHGLGPDSRCQKISLDLRSSIPQRVLGCHCITFLFRIWFVSTAGVGGRTRDPPTYIHCALLRKPTKGSNCNGTRGELSTEPRLIAVVRIASRAGLNRWERQIPSSTSHSQTGPEPNGRAPRPRTPQTPSLRFQTVARSQLREPASSV